MNWEYSCGAVVFTRQNGQILYVIVQEKSGAYSFPKGHVEGGETEMDTARREISEETGLQPAFLPGFCHREEYHLSEKPGTWKRVTYFLAEFKNQSLVAQESEIRNILLLPYEQAYSLFPYENTRQVLSAAHAFLTK